MSWIYQNMLDRLGREDGEEHTLEEAEAVADDASMGTKTASDLLRSVSGTDRCPLDYLREDEDLQFYLSGRGDTFVTDERILKIAGYPATEFRVEYADVETVEVEDAMTDSTIQVETPDRTYSLSADENTEDERRECADYIRSRAEL